MRKVQEIIKVKDKRPKKGKHATTNSDAHKRRLKTIDTGRKFLVKPLTNSKELSTTGEIPTCFDTR
jgi:hypothetical protein